MSLLYSTNPQMAYSHLTYLQRKTIERMLRLGDSQAAVARTVGVHRSTIKKEVDRNSVDGEYCAAYAETLTIRRKQRGGYKAKGPGFRKRPTSQLSFFVDEGKEKKRYACRFPRRKLKSKDKRRKRQASFGYELSTQQAIQRAFKLSRRKRWHMLERFKRSDRWLYWKMYYKRSSLKTSSWSVNYRRLVKHPRKRFFKGPYRFKLWPKESFKEANNKARLFPYIPYLTTLAKGRFRYVGINAERNVKISVSKREIKFKYPFELEYGPIRYIERNGGAMNSSETFKRGVKQVSCSSKSSSSNRASGRKENSEVFLGKTVKPLSIAPKLELSFSTFLIKSFSNTATMKLRAVCCFGFFGYGIIKSMNLSILTALSVN